MLDFSQTTFSKQNRYHQCSIAMRLPERVKDDFSWVYKGLLPFSQNTFFEKVHDIVTDKSMSKINVQSLHHNVVLALKSENISTFGTNILLLIKFAFDSYNLLSNWIVQGNESGTDLGLPDAQFQAEIHVMHEEQTRQLFKYQERL